MDAIKNTLNSYASEDRVATEIMLGIVLCILILILYYLIKGTSNMILGKKMSNSIVYKGLKSADVPVTITQDPSYKNSNVLQRSVNEDGGIEFTYSVWIWLDTKTWKVNDSETQWKHVFHKGPMRNSEFTGSSPDTMSEIQCPGLWIGKNSNELRLYINTFGINSEYIQIKNLPLKKWFCFIYTQTNFVADVYINGRLKEQKELRTLPRQNYSNLYINQNEGFEGYISNLSYYNYAANPSKIHDITKAGPNLKFYKQTFDESSSVKIDNEIPYLSNRWWTNDLTLSN